MSYIYIDHILSNFSSDVGIDLGTSNTPVLVRGRGIVLREPSYVARDLKTGGIIAVGSEAKAMEGRTPPHIEVIRPIRDGVIADFDIAEKLINYLLKNAKAGGVFNPRVIIGVPTDCTDVEWRAVSEAAVAAGARRVYIIEQPLAGAIGAGLPVLQAIGSMVFDIGGGTSEVAVTSMGGIVNAKTSRIAGDEMDEAILNYVRKAYNMLIGIRTAEELKISIGTARKTKVSQTAQVKGRDLTSGLPRTLEVESNEIAEALSEIIQSMVDLLKQTLESTPPELVSDIFEQGVVMIGGGSLLRDLDKVLSESTGVMCRCIEDPTSAVALGTDKLFKSPKLFKAVFLNREKQMQL
jgi:rod shape-determining protein MreB and related proteins